MKQLIINPSKIFYSYTGILRFVKKLNLQIRQDNNFLTSTISKAINIDFNPFLIYFRNKLIL